MTTKATKIGITKKDCGSQNIAIMLGKPLILSPNADYLGSLSEAALHGLHKIFL